MRGPFSTTDLHDIPHKTSGAQWHEQHSRKRERWYSHEGPAEEEFGKVLSVSDVDEHLLNTDRTTPIHIVGRESTSVEQKRSYTNILVAVKKFILPSTYDNDDSKTTAELNEEVRIIRKLSHFHIIEAIGSYRCESTQGIIMLPWAACNLRQILVYVGDKDKKRPEYISEGLENYGWHSVGKFVASTMGCLASALSHIHSKGIKHKDIRPENILVNHARVYITDFDLSIDVKDNSNANLTSASIGPPKHRVHYTYAAPEAYEDENIYQRGTAQDIYSLGCVFVEIFAVYMHRHVKDVHELFEKGTGSYRENIRRVLRWVLGETQRMARVMDWQFYLLLQAMVNRDPTRRPRASTVWKKLVSIRDDKPGRRFCGACCTPLELQLDQSVEEEPQPMVSTLPTDGRRKLPKSANNDTDFKTKYGRSTPPPYERVRELHLDPICHFIIDEVIDMNNAREGILCRKSFHVNNDHTSNVLARPDLRRLVKTEVDILQRLNRSHLPTFHATYLFGDNGFTILTKPALTMNLHEFLDLLELEREDGVDYQLSRDLLRWSPGCLAGAVSYLHKIGFVHGDITSNNVLVEPGHEISGAQVVLANFGRAAIIKEMKDVYMTGMLIYGEPESEFHFPPTPSNDLKSEVMYESSDVFSLGCIFLEMETVRLGQTRKAMWKVLDRRTREFFQLTTLERTIRESLPLTDWDIEVEKSVYAWLSGDGQYKDREVLANLPKWIKYLQLYKPDGHGGFGEMIKSMVHEDPRKRPSANQVFHDTVTKLRDHRHPKIRCGTDCILEAEYALDPALPMSFN